MSNANRSFFSDLACDQLNIEKKNFSKRRFSASELQPLLVIHLTLTLRFERRMIDLHPDSSYKPEMMEALAQSKDYRAMLRQELEKRCSRNVRYSLRSFARDLELAPARLSDVLRGRYGLSRQAAEKIAEKLGWSAPEIAYFCDLVDSAHARSKSKKNEAQARLKATHGPLAYQQLTLDAFHIISDWHHFAILELALTNGFRSDVDWIARQLGISPHMAHAAVQRLKRLELIRESLDGTLVPENEFTASPTGVPSEAIRKFHRQILQKALSALELQAVDERDFSSMILAVNKKDLPRAKDVIKGFRRQFDAEFGQSKSKDEVYCLAVQFFRLQEKSVK